MKIQIKYLNGIRYKYFIINSAQRINQMEQHLNDINVFPVADRDTGTNMVATMSSIVKGIKKSKESSFAKISSVIADSALNGARGNSRAILAQFFQGLAENRSLSFFKKTFLKKKDFDIKVSICSIYNK